MRTLLLTNSYLAGNSGGIYASRTHINLFAEVSESMTLIYPINERNAAKYIFEEKINMVPVGDFRSNLRKFIDLCCGKVHRFILDKGYFDAEKYDVVVFDNSVVSSRLVKRFKKAGIKTITIHHNYQVEYLLGDSPLLTLLPDLFWTWVYERQAVKYSDLNITLTNQDIELLQKHYDKKAAYSSLGVFEFNRKEPVELTTKERNHKYVITGGLSFKQTERSLMRWIRTYYPVLKKEDPLAVLTIAGSNPSATLSSAIEKSGIQLVASPPDMAPILQEADYYICPVDRGGGLKLRNLDGLKFGLPVLTHKVSLRGYEKMAEAGFVFSYDNPYSFAEGIRNMLKLEVDRRTIQKQYLNQYEFDKGVCRLAEILKQLS